MKYYTYVIKSISNGKCYTGHTQNLENRLKEHNTGKTKSTKANIPYEIVFYEVCNSRRAVVEKEKFFKTGMGRAYIRTKINRHT